MSIRTLDNLTDALDMLEQGDTIEARKEFKRERVEGLGHPQRNYALKHATRALAYATTLLDMADRSALFRDRLMEARYELVHKRRAERLDKIVCEVFHVPAMRKAAARVKERKAAA